MMLPLTLNIFIFIQLIAVAIVDLKERKISNKWHFLNLILYVIFNFLFPDYFSFSLESIQYSLLFLGIGFLLFNLGVMGGGDSKYLATLFLIVPSATQDKLMYHIINVTILIALILCLKNILKHRKELWGKLKSRNLQGVKSYFGGKFPYAPVILLAWVVLNIEQHL